VQGRAALGGRGRSVNAPAADAFTNRLLAALADVPVGGRAHFGKIARQLKVSATEVTIGVWQLVNSGRLDRETLRPVHRTSTRPYCQHPEDCRAGPRGICTMRCGPAQLRAVPSAPVDSAPKPPPVRPGTQIWCGQCDRRVAVEKAVNCRSAWCKAELPPQLKECKLA
jgi:hypothetical protein